MYPLYTVTDTNRPLAQETKWGQNLSQYFHMECLRPACVCVCAYRASAIPPKLRTHTYYIHTRTIISVHMYICTNPCTHTYRHAHSYTNSQHAHSYTNSQHAWVWWVHTAHSPWPRCHCTEQHKKQKTHKTSLQPEGGMMWLHTYIHMHIHTHVPLALIGLSTHMYVHTHMYLHLYT